MNSPPLVSVVVPTYHRNGRLHEALDSVVAQTYDELEPIVVDGSPGREAEAVVEAYPDARYVHQGDAPAGVSGVADARDLGVEASSGSLVRFLDDDDRLDPEVIETQVEVVESAPDVGVVYCGMARETGQTELPHGDVRGEVLEYALKFQVSPCLPSTMLVRRSLFEQLPPMRELPHDDAALVIELALRTEFDFVEEALVFRGDSERSLAGSYSSLAGRRRTIEAYGDLYASFPPEVERTALARVYLQEGTYYLGEHPWSARAIRALVLANYYSPRTDLLYVGLLLASLFGKPGLIGGKRLYRSFLSKSTRAGAEVQF